MGVVVPETFPKTKLFMVVVEPRFTVTLELISTSSLDVGTIPVDQFAAVDQLVSVPPTQLTLAAQVFGIGIFENVATTSVEIIKDLMTKREYFRIFSLSSFLKDMIINNIGFMPLRQ